MAPEYFRGERGGGFFFFLFPSEVLPRKRKKKRNSTLLTHAVVTSGHPRLHDLFLWNHNAHGLMTHFSRAPFMSTRNARLTVSFAHFGAAGSKRLLEPVGDVVAAAMVVAVPRLALVVAATGIAQTGVAGFAPHTRSPVTVLVCRALCGGLARRRVVAWA